MGKYQAYPEYKNSGVEWMGIVPSSWKVVPCRAAVENLVSKNEGGANQNYLSLMANVGVIRYEDKGDVGNKKPEDLSKCKIVKKGNLVINSMNYAIGSYGMSDYDGVCSPVYIVLNSYQNVIEPRFALRVFENKPFQKYLATFGNGILEHRSAIGWDDIKGAYIPLPSKKEQVSILQFLDHETAKIDTLIDKQQQLIQLLKEKRQAVISHAVTKGLNPNAPMRDSGVEWLGEVPEHWRSIPLRLIVRTRKGIAFKSADFCDGGIRVVKASDIKQKTIRETDVFLPEGFVRDYPKALLSTGDIILSTVGSTPDVINSAVGQIGMVPKNLNGSLLNQNTVVFDPDENKVSREYLFYVLQMEGYRKHLDIHAHGTANQSSLSIEDMLNFTISFPTLKEQYEVCQYIRQRQEVLDDLEINASISESLLKERRTALISAAVTGKIDVRHPVCHPTDDLQSSKSAVHGDL